ncbi:uncharacterized protein LOC144920825 [Branchiostoma floridae x Branchiostoma belcheri]
MGRKLRHVMIFLLIILKEPNMPDAKYSCEPSPHCLKEPNLPEADCSCKPSSHCLKEPNMPEVDCSYLPNLGSLFLDNNQITKIHVGTFKNLPNLGNLRLFGNKITMIQAETFQNLPRLRKLDLAYNQIATIQKDSFQKLPMLEELSLGGNKITMIQAGSFHNLRGLKYLHLSRNQITEIQLHTFRNLPLLEKLHLSHNNIRVVIFANLPRLAQLYLDNNRLTTFPSGAFLNLPLLDLHLSANRIKMIQPHLFQKLSLLEQLCLGGNKLTKITTETFQNLTRLQKVYLLHNQMTRIPTGTFANLPQLQKVNLYNNRIDTIQSNAFENLPLLEILDLSFNRLSAILPAAFSLLPSIRAIKLDFNPFQCDCKMAPFILNITKIPSNKFSNMKCRRPRNLWNKMLTDIDPKDICNEATVSPTTVDIRTSLAAGNTESNTGPSSHLVGLISATQPHVNAVEIAESCYNNTVTYHWFFTRTAGSTAHPASNASKTRATLTPPLAITSDKPETTPSSPLPVLFGSVSGSVAGTVLMGAIIFTVWYKMKKGQHPLGPTPNVVGGNTNAVISVMTSSNDKQYGDIDSNHDQTGQGQSQDNIKSLKVANLSDILAALKPNAMYGGMKTPPIDPPSTVCNDQTGRGQSQAITESNTNTTATVMASSHHQTGQGQSQANTEPSINTTATYCPCGFEKSHNVKE